MVIYLYGPDSYRRSEKLRELTRAYAEKNPERDTLHINLEDEGVEGWMRAKDFLGQPSMFVEMKLLVLTEVAQESHEAWVSLLHAERNSEKTFVIISDSLTPHKSFKFLLEKPVHTQHFPELNGRELETFLLTIAKTEGFSFTPEGWRAFLLALRTFGEGSGKTWRAISEIKKLALLTEGGEIDAEAIQKGIHFSPTRDFYGLTRETLFGRSVGARLLAVEELTAGNFDSGWIFNTLCFLAKGKEALILARADIDIKSGVLDYETAITRVALG